MFWDVYLGVVAGGLTLGFIWLLVVMKAKSDGY